MTKRNSIPYARQCIDETDIDAVVEVLQSDYLTTGPAVVSFEKAVAEYVDCLYGVAVCNGTAALHCAMAAAEIEPGDEVIVSPLTFVASANAALYCGAQVKFADVVPETGLIDPAAVESLVTPRTKAVVAVDYGGQTCDYPELQQICQRHNLTLIADCAHSIGARPGGHSVTEYADMAIFSFHPVKHITSGEGGMVVTNSGGYAARAASFRNHGIDLDANARAKNGRFSYQMTHLGYNYRLSDIHCALGAAQLKKLPMFIERRREIAFRYDSAFAQNDAFDLLNTGRTADHVYHLYVLRLASRFDANHRQLLYDGLQQAGIGVNVHYLPIYLHRYYREQFQTTAGLCPNAEQLYEHVVSLPMFPDMTDDDVVAVIAAVNKVSSEVLT